jgi:hypothetical protein
VITRSLSRLRSGERQSSVAEPRHKGIFLPMDRSQLPGSVHSFTESVQEQAERVCAASNYWSSTTNANNPNNAWNVNFNNGNVNNNNKTNNNFVLPVRGGS